MKIEDDLIRRCVVDCARARDWRGRWRQERNCMAALRRAGTSQAISHATAAASARLGAWIAQRGADLAKEVSA